MTEEIGGMTVNERLWHLGLFERFDACVERGDRDGLRAVLKECALSDENIERIIEKVFAAG